MLGRLFSRPKWQHRNPLVRAESVRELPQGDPRLTALASSDPDPAVRRQAVRRLEDPALLAELATVDTDQQVRDAVRRRLCRLLSGEAPSALGPDERRAAARALTDGVVAAYLLSHADSVPIRMDALARVERQAVLGEVALGDPALDVRLAALERLDQTTVLERVAKQARGKDKRVARLARAKLEELAARAERPRRQVELCEALERLAEGAVADIARARQVEGQWQALAEDAPPALQERASRAMAELERIVAERQAAAEHLAHQRELCARAETLLEEVTAAVADEQAQVLPLHQAAALLDSAWRSLAENGEVNTGCEARFVDAFTSLNTRLCRLDEDRAAHARFQSLVDEARSVADGPALLGRHALGRLEARWGDLESRHPVLATEGYQSAFKAAMERAAGRIREVRGQEKALTTELERLLSDLEQALSEGELQHAISSRDKARDRLGKLQAIGAAHMDGRQRRLRRLEGRLAELRDWRRYGLEQVRQELIERMQALVGDTTPPPKLAGLVHQLQEEWRGLDRANGPASEALWQAFDQAGHQAFEPCRAFFADQEAQRQAHIHEREAFCDDLEAAYHLVNWEQPDWAAVERDLRAARRRWRKLGGVAPEAWRTLDSRFRGLVDGFERQLEPERQREKERREQAIRQLEALAGESDLRRATALAKQAQAEWAPTVPLPRRAEQALWRRFKAANDAIFKQLDVRRSARKREEAEAVAAREALCAEAEALSRLPVEQAGAKAHTLREAWRQAPDPSRRPLVPLEKRFFEALDALDRQTESAIRAAHLEQERRWAQRAAVCERLEAALESGGEAPADVDGGIWASLPPLDDETVAAAFDRRYERVVLALRGDERMRQALRESLAANLALKERLCLELELLAGIESPPQFADARLALQVERLSSAMTGGGMAAAQEGEDARAELLRRWYLAGPVAESDHRALAARLQRALARLQGSGASGAGE